MIPRASLAGGAIAIVGAADFTRTISLGTVIVGLIVVIAFGWFQLHDKKATAATEAAGRALASWEAEAAAQKERGDRLQADKDQAIADCNAAKLELAEAQKRPDMTQVRDLLKDTAEIMGRAIANHDQRATTHLTEMSSQISVLAQTVTTLTKSVDRLMGEHWKTLGALSSVSTGNEEPRHATERIQRRRAEE